MKGLCRRLFRKYVLYVSHRACFVDSPGSGMKNFNSFSCIELQKPPNLFAQGFGSVPCMTPSFYVVSLAVGA